MMPHRWYRPLYNNHITRVSRVQHSMACGFEKRLCFLYRKLKAKRKLYQLVPCRCISTVEKLVAIGTRQACHTDYCRSCQLFTFQQIR